MQHRSQIIKNLGLTEELAKEIEEYCKLQGNTIFAPTLIFRRVRANLHGDVPLAWTAVQVYIHCLITSNGRPLNERLALLASVAFPDAQDIKTKILWLAHNPGIYSYRSLSHSYCYTYFISHIVLLG